MPTLQPETTIWATAIYFAEHKLGFFRLLRPRRSLHRGQRFDVVRDRGAILRRQLRSVADHARHRAASGVAFRRLSALQEIRDIFRAPVAKTLLRDVGHPALAFRIRSAGK